MEQYIRKAVPADAGRMEELYRMMRQAIYGPEDQRGYDAGYLDRYFYKAGNRAYVVERPGRIVAFVSLEEHREEPEAFVYVDDISVEPECRGQGIGKRLLVLAEEYAGERGIFQMRLHVEDSNAGARKLYASCGYGEYRMTGSRHLLKKVIPGGGR